MNTHREKQKPWTGRDWFGLMGAILICQLAGIIGSLFTSSAIPTWYAMLVKPALNPPAWVFGPVWTVLYCLMGIALFLVGRRGWTQSKVRIALSMFAIQLLLNALWSIVFFGLQSPGGALITIAFLWISILATIFLFASISKTASRLLLPYLVWVSFASYLNYALWVLNE